MVLNLENLYHILAKGLNISSIELSLFLNKALHKNF